MALVRERTIPTERTVQYTYNQKHPHIKNPSQTHTLQNPLIHTLQNNIKPPQYKLKQN
jgi:DNA-directed RNA polymerase subunit L